MDGKLALFAYDFPHKKTQDFLYEIRAAGLTKVIVFAAPKKKLLQSDNASYFANTIYKVQPIDTNILCRCLGYRFISISHDDVDGIKKVVKKEGLQVAIISGARILNKEVINLFKSGIINFHPGKIPETSGLDSFYYSIMKKIPLGVTAHFIDHRVDAGKLIEFKELNVELGCSPESVVHSNYNLQLVTLRSVLKKINNNEIAYSEIERPKKNEPLTPDHKRYILTKFNAWLNYISFKQKINDVFKFSESGSVDELERILIDYPDLIDYRNPEGWTPLIVASYHGHLPIVEKLLAKGADPNALGKNGTTVLMYAKTRLLNTNLGYQVLDTLIKYGAVIDRVDSYGKDIFHYVDLARDRRMHSFLMSKLNEN